ncbi:unnamed protein product, partial [Didymodactylos carnosus]
FLSERKHIVRVRTHHGQKLSDLNEKLKNKYKSMVQSSDTGIFVCGTNSISNLSASKCIEEAESIIKTTKLINPNMNICMVTIPFRSRPLNEGTFGKIAEYNKQLKLLCYSQKVEFLRVTFEKGMLYDKLHPNSLGYQLM